MMVKICVMININVLILASLNNHFFLSRRKNDFNILYLLIYMNLFHNFLNSYQPEIIAITNTYLHGDMFYFNKLKDKYLKELIKTQYHLLAVIGFDAFHNPKLDQCSTCKFVINCDKINNSIDMILSECSINELNQLLHTELQGEI